MLAACLLCEFEMDAYDRQIQSAKKQIAKKGQAVIWRIVENGNPSNALEPWKPTQPSSQVEHAVQICFLPLDKETKKWLVRSRDVETSTSYELGLMPSVGFEPSLKDTVLRSGVELRIESLEKIAPNGEAILYKIVFRK